MPLRATPTTQNLSGSSWSPRGYRARESPAGARGRR
jgi:hypothetical protein